MSTERHPITSPPPHLLKKFSTEARDESNKRNGTGYLKTFAKLCIEWANSKSTSNSSQIRSSEITPPPELVQQWVDEYIKTKPICAGPELIATSAAQWGADMELEACCEWVRSMFSGHPTWADELLADRRPKPPTRKQQALTELGNVYDSGRIDDTTYDTIRRALEALDD